MRNWRWVMVIGLAAVARVGMAQTTAPGSLPAIVRDLGSADFALRNAAQQALSAIPPEQEAGIRDALKVATDAEVKTRLDARIAEIEVYTALHPKPLTVDLTNRTLGDLVNALNEQLGIEERWGVRAVKVSSGSGLAVAITAQDQPLWEILRQVQEKTPLYITSAMQTNGPRQVINLATGLTEVVQMQRLYVTDGIGIVAHAGNNISGECVLTCEVFTDPRVRLASAKAINLELALDQDGKSLKQVVPAAETRALTSAARPSVPPSAGRTNVLTAFTCRATFANGPGVNVIKEVRGTVDVEVVVRERTVVVDLTKETNKPFPVGDGTLSVDAFPDGTIVFESKFRGGLNVELFGENHVKVRAVSIPGAFPGGSTGMSAKAPLAKTMEYAVTDQTRPAKLPIVIRDLPVKPASPPHAGR